MRNRRNTRRRNVILETITNKNFIKISSILLVAIIILFGSIKIRNYFDKKQLAEQAKELDKQTGEIFTAMNNEIKETNIKKEGIKKTYTAKIAAVGDILCQMDIKSTGRKEVAGMEKRKFEVEEMSDMKRAEILGRIDELDKLEKKISSHPESTDAAKVIEEIEKQKEMLRAELNA